MNSIESKLQKLEKIQAAEPPTDLFGKPYDSLTRKDRARYLRYIYDDYTNFEAAERIEKEARGTLHFVCSEKIEAAFNLDDDFFTVLSRSLELELN